MLTNHDSIRALFPGTADKTFLDAACVSIAPTAATEAITRFLNDATLCPEISATAQHIAMDAAREAARAEAALEKAGIRLIALRATPSALVLRVPPERIEEATRVLHAAFLE